MLRWPGGNFAGEFNWMDGLLPADMRAPFQSYWAWRPSLHTMGYDYSEINTDDFIALCRKGLAPSRSSPLTPAGIRRGNSAWVEYCNGDASTPMGSSGPARSPRALQCAALVLGQRIRLRPYGGRQHPWWVLPDRPENGKKMRRPLPTSACAPRGPIPTREWVELSAKPLGGISQMISPALLRLCPPLHRPCHRRGGV